MIRERVADNVYVFTSELYAQVNAGAVIGPDFSVVIDTLAYPEETLEIRDFVENRLGSRVRYVINTHYHADHSLGNVWFKGAVVIGHRLARALMDSRGRESLDRARVQSRELREVELLLPDVVFDGGELNVRVGKRTLQLHSLPGHSPDGLGVLVLEDRVLFSGDVMMPLPHLVNGDLDAMTASLKRIPRLKLENVVQGHGEVVLRGEILNAVRSNLNYVACVRREVTRASRRRDPLGYLASVSIEACGKSRILLGGLADELHRRNLAGVYRSSYGEE
ncbi:MAG: MBL fold metallo-hydrolase [Anaerolineales bacterium]|nr:MBL fold metallo-hydrolase [Anaerolineales bacterium]